MSPFSSDPMILSCHHVEPAKPPYPVLLTTFTLEKKKKNQTIFSTGLLDHSARSPPSYKVSFKRGSAPSSAPILACASSAIRVPTSGPVLSSQKLPLTCTDNTRFPGETTRMHVNSLFNTARCLCVYIVPIVVRMQPTHSWHPIALVHQQFNSYHTT